jgi:mono/diheme cytochrome c family protein
MGFRTSLKGALATGLLATTLRGACCSNLLEAKGRGEEEGIDAGTALSPGRSLFLKNCAHCHGNDARGDEGSDLHGVKLSDALLMKKIRNGIKGEMPAFGEKFRSEEISALISFLRSLK